jgi:hypothetical protein
MPELYTKAQLPQADALEIYAVPLLEKKLSRILGMRERNTPECNVMGWSCAHEQCTNDKTIAAHGNLGTRTQASVSDIPHTLWRPDAHALHVA